MIHPQRTLEQISDGLLKYLRAELDSSLIAYNEPLAQIQGGNETYTYRFELSGVEQNLAKPLILRLYPQIYGAGNAVRESVIQNALAEKGYPVPHVYFTCADLSLLGGAFFVMELLPGELMMTAPFETIPSMLGKTHASLHNVDPEPLIKSLQERAFNERSYKAVGRLDWLADKASGHPWMHTAVDWLIENRPPESELPAICHGDFHPLNILIKDGHVTGVLDWPGFLIDDPVLDVANTIVLMTIPAKHVYSVVETDKLIEKYLESYRARRTLNLQHLDYYMARRCVFALVEGAEGQEAWQQPPIVDDLIETIDRVTGIRIIPPG